MLGLPPSTTRTHTLVPYTTLFRAQTPAQRDENGDADQRKDEQRPGEADDRQYEEGRDRGADDGAEPEGGRYERQCLRALLGVGARGDIGLHRGRRGRAQPAVKARSEEHTSELQSLMRISYAVFCLKKKNTTAHK